MKVLLIHSYYQIRGGEDQVLEQERDLLAQNHEVEVVSFLNAGRIAGLKQFLTQRNNKKSNDEVREKLENFNPDVVHIHNLHFAGGWGVINVIAEQNIPIIMTLHNYRLLCPSGTLFFHGNLFLESLAAGFSWAAVNKKVYRNSKLLTFWLALTLYRNRIGGLLSKIDRFITLTPFAKDLFVKNLPEISPSRFVIKPNFVNQTEGNSIDSIRENHYLFIGRLSEEKGLLVLLDAFKDSNYEIRIAGTGPLESMVLEAQSKYPKNISFLGRLASGQVRKEMAIATALIFPSIWYEGMPLTIVEAFASGLPVIASRIGAMSSMVKEGETGFLFQPGDGRKLKEALKQWELLSTEDRQRYQTHCQRTYSDLYTPKQNAVLLDKIYKEVINNKIQL